MKLLNHSVILLFTLLFILPASAQKEARFKGFGFDKLTQNLCQAVKLKSPTQMRSNLLDAKMHISEIYSHVNCDGLSLLQVAELHESTRVVAYLKSKVSGLNSELSLVAAGKL